MINPAFIVEGQQEQLIVKKLCPNAPVRILGCNGDHVSIEAVAKKAGSLARLLERKCQPIIVLFDREKRKETCEQLEEDLLMHLANSGVTARIIVGIADRELENWMLADYGTITAILGREQTLFDTATDFEGVGRKSKLKALLPDKMRYIETIQGVAWFTKCNPTTMCSNSKSFRMFVRKIQELDCRWLQQLQFPLE